MGNQKRHGQPTGLVTGAVLSTAPCLVSNIKVYNNSTTDSHIISIHDASSTPSDSVAADEINYKIPPGQTFDIDLSDNYQDGRQFNNGVYVCGSSTPITKTIIVTMVLKLGMDIANKNLEGIEYKQFTVN